MAQAQTPYSPPVARVSDPAEAEVPKPAAISRAAWCLWISAAVVVLSMGFTAAGMSGEGGQRMLVITVSSISAGLLALVAWLLNAGHGWIRWLFLALFVLGSGMFAVGVVTAPKEYLALPLTDQISMVVQFGLQTAALIFMFTPAAWHWLASRKRK
jgi:hypothetical protein